jgi:predicted Zn-dependent protease with MMP-like domain
MKKTDDRDPDLEVLERIYDALDEGDPECALRLAGEALSVTAKDDPVVHFLAGMALLELERSEEAVSMLRTAATLDPDDPDIHANLALSLYLCCRFEEAEREAAATLEMDSRSPDGHYVTALLLERSELQDRADTHFDQAAKLDPERFPRPLRLSADEFEREVLQAREMLDERFMKLLDHVVVTIEKLPSEEVLRDDSPPHPPDLFGLFVGLPRTEQSSFSTGGELPPRILLFQRNLERHFPERVELGKQIAITLHHELGHYLGMDEEQLDELRLL